ncbi:hypothetical protein UN63_12375 [Oceanisphaera arctica]|uniref:Uncharacterized protein n=2 Tax=Oceanisphaera arctica TaxID=641510 RepID=A0A2P5TK98_9GAMM|nr:hypothetical protein UN63_12375 [Oceanisphaera arctica]
MRARLQRSRVAAEWSRLSTQQRAMLCYGAKLRPSSYAELALEEMTDDEREHIRLALVEMKRGLHSLTTTDRTEWRQVAGNCQHHQKTKKEQARTEQQGRLRLDRQIRQLSDKLNAVNAKSPVSSN